MRSGCAFFSSSVAFMSLAYSSLHVVPLILSLCPLFSSPVPLLQNLLIQAAPGASTAPPTALASAIPAAAAARGTLRVGDLIIVTRNETVPGYSD